MIILEFINFIVGLAIIFFTIIIFHPIRKYKKLTTKEEQLFLQKTLITTIFFISILIINILFILTILNDSSILFLIEVFAFNTYIIVLSLYNFFLSLELYNTYINPVHFFNKLLKQQKHNYFQEFYIFIIILISVSADFFLYKFDKYEIKNNINQAGNENNNNNKAYFCNDSSIFILIAKWKSFFLIIISLISLIICQRIKSKIKKFAFKNQEKLYNIIGKRSLSNILYLIYGLLYSLPIFFRLKISELYNIYGSVFFLIILSNDFIIHMSIIASSKFCEYRLQKTLLGYFCSCFVKQVGNYSSASAPLIEDSINDLNILANDETTTALEINTNNPKDKELISTYKNGIFIEDYFLGYFDQILNIITSSIFQVYNSNYFSSQANEKILTNKIGTDVSSIGGQNLTFGNTSNIGSKTVLDSKGDVGGDTANFIIKKNMEMDKLQRFKEVLEDGINITNNNHYLDVNVKSFFTNRCVTSIYEQKLKGRQIGNSLLTHMVLKNGPKKKNLDNPNSFYCSLLAFNAREEYFCKLKNTSIKTYDKNYTLDIFDTDDRDISFDSSGNNRDFAILLDKYFAYMHEKGINGTFIPFLVGAFKVKINNFKTLLIVVSKNSLVENVPKGFYTYWQLIRFLHDKPQKMTSSQFKSGTLVKDDPIFERAFQIETKKDNPNYNKIFLKNFSDFEETIKEDLLFLKQCGVQNFFLYLMYYEYENTQKHEKQGAIKIRQTKHGPELVEESLPQDNLFNEENPSTPISNFGSKNTDSLGGGFLSMAGGFLDDNDIGGKNNNNKNIGNLFDVEEKVNIIGYEGIFDSFNCLCFFTFENVFDIRKRSSLSFNYNDFQKRILTNFTNYKKEKK